MCSVVILYRPGHRWPVLLAANRDEMAGRPWKPPARHWPERADVTAGLDEKAGGTWLGLNDYGVVAAVLNRPGTLGPQAGSEQFGQNRRRAIVGRKVSEPGRVLPVGHAGQYHFLKIRKYPVHRLSFSGRCLGDFF